MTENQTVETTANPLEGAATFALYLEGDKNGPIPMVARQSKSGNVFWTLPKQGPTGKQISPRAASLPLKLKVAQVQVTKDKNGKPKVSKVAGTDEMPVTLSRVFLDDKETGNKTRSGVEFGPQKVVLPNGEEKMARFIFSIVRRNNVTCWNAKASFYGTGGGFHISDDDLDWATLL